ncbi:hypothetical protein LP109_10040 [Moraxella bovis]|nr:hypothetical protein [Moraxella bovis]UZA15990.1 hypothetical protein LP109_10040 [Moraxella bovis]
MADELVGLVLDGKKRATCTALHWDLDEPAYPVGNLQVITDGQNRPAVLSKTPPNSSFAFVMLMKSWHVQKAKAICRLIFGGRLIKNFLSGLGYLMIKCGCCLRPLML